MDEEMIRDYLKQHPKMSMQAKINMLNEILMSKLENELAGKGVSYTPEEKKGAVSSLPPSFWQEDVERLHIQALPAVSGKPGREGAENTFYRK